MTEPKFQVGQAVGVCTPGLEVVLPKTIVTSAQYFQRKPFTHPITRERSYLIYEGWAYKVAGCPFGSFYREALLRPIDPDKEYQDENEKETQL